MAPRYATDDEMSSTAKMVRVLVEAGYDPSSDHEMQMGLTAYHAALLTYGYATRKPQIQHAQKARAGRNDPCPCGSGKKYKKCCVDLDRPLPAANDGVLQVKFDPGMVPRLWGDDRDGSGLYEDYAQLSQIMYRDPAFAGIGFSAEQVTAFLDAIAEGEPELAKGLEKNDPAAFDAVRTRFLKEHSPEFGQRTIKDRCLEAAKRAKSSDDVRALATGICLALLDEVSDDPDENPLADILFQKALIEGAGTVHIIDRVMNRFPDNADELCRLMEANDPSINEKLEAAANELSPAEVEILHTSVDKLHERLWDTITAGEFPVPLPLATQLAMFGRLYVAAGDGPISQDRLIAALKASTDELIEEDYVQFSQILDRGLRGSKEEPPGRITEAMRTMRSLCAIRSIGDFAPVLFISCLRERRQAPFDADELRFIEGAQDATDKRAFITEYSAWLRTKGYPGMADRLLRCWNADASLQGKRAEATRRIA